MRNGLQTIPMPHTILRHSAGFLEGSLSPISLENYTSQVQNNLQRSLNNVLTYEKLHPIIVWIQN